MTCREKLKIEHPILVNDKYTGGCNGCPHHYGYLPKCKGCTISCYECWDQEIPETEKQTNNNSRLINDLTKTIEKLRNELKETRMKLEEKDRCLTDNTKALLSMAERINKYEANGEHINKKASDYRMKFQALINQGFTEDQAMQFLPMWMDD